ncbi:glycogen debranching protein GlgX [Methylotetracoccus oryzae]|uniref:glycogen debranching protein GlgX n=1 Tax=Methylotetracoccus oryzae TaxID=1919059 RepID=UPI001117C8A5|nr:glycogen debranching protein GlgX [Methylotetracoccus oryzae]
MNLDLLSDRFLQRATRAFRCSDGSPLPLGPSLQSAGVNFSLFSRNATRVWLLLYETAEAREPCSIVQLDPRRNRTGDIWHIRVEGVGRGLAYAFRVDGPCAPEQGHRFAPERVLIDPYATALYAPPNWTFDEACGDRAQSQVRSLVTAPQFDWEGDRPLRLPWSETVIYETHVRGLTWHPSSRVNAPGTYRGVIDKIPYFKELGITAIEFLPLQEFNPDELTRVNPMSGERLTNYWGYSTIAFFAPHQGFGTRRYPGCQVDEFKEMVKALHQAGIEVLLDVVFNHTAEGDETGPTFSFRGLDNSIYYLLEDDKRSYKNYSGCGNTVNCNHPVVINFILECLRYWVVEMHVDGFRFDLASILSRDRSGRLIPNPPLLEAISEDPILRQTKLIAEAWDAGGAYLVGRFPGDGWSEWNGVYRDDVRRYWRGDQGMAGAFAQRLTGSADLYEHSGRSAVHSINFVTCHDGFTLNDLVSYEQKHNWANGESNRDGCDANFSANYGVEGPTDDPQIQRIRTRQMKNFLATLLLSRGVPMLLGGDEFCRTQRGNNNAYCQDNEVSWFDWRLVEQNRAMLEFTRGLLAFRARHQVVSRDEFYRPQDLSWFNACGWMPEWHSDAAIGCHFHCAMGGERQLCMLFNPTSHAVNFVLPHPPENDVWLKAIDTGATPPFDICAPGAEIPLFEQDSLLVWDKTLVVLLSDRDPRLK